MGKIPLTNAELIKALFLSEENLSKEQNSEYLNLRKREIASEWDMMEQKLREEEFWYFLQDGSIDYDNHIEFIFDLIARNTNSSGRRRSIDEFHTFRFFRNQIDGSETSFTIWNTVKDCFQKLSDWYSTRRLFHLVGFLIAVGENIETLLTESEGLTKRDFNSYLNRKIRKYVPDEILELSYQDDKTTLREVLLLFNVLSILSNPKTNLRFQFGRYKIENWDIEHIHSVESLMPESKAHQIDWLNEVAQFTADNKLKDRILRYFETPLDKREEFKVLYMEIVAYYSDQGEQKAEKQQNFKGDSDINDISNLALLDSGTNRGYKNAVFPIKRKIIIEKDESGTFIPLCTKNVFLKYYNRNLEQSTFWGRADRDAYKSQLMNVFKEFITPLENEY